MMRLRTLIRSLLRSQGGRLRENYEDTKGFFREPLLCQAGKSYLRECESVKETLRVSDDDVRAAGGGAGVTVPDGGGIVRVVTVRAG